MGTNWLIWCGVVLLVADDQRSSFMTNVHLPPVGVLLSFVCGLSVLRPRLATLDVSRYYGSSVYPTWRSDSYEGFVCPSSVVFYACCISIVWDSQLPYLAHPCRVFSEAWACHISHTWWKYCYSCLNFLTQLFQPVGRCQIVCSDVFVMRSCMMFCDIVALVSRSRAPVGSELALICTATYPVETHIHSFGPFLMDFVSDDNQRGGVVSLYWGWGLMMSHRLG